MAVLLIAFVAWVVLGSVLGAVSCAYGAIATVTETLPNNSGSASDLKRQVAHDQFNESFTLDGGSTPPATLVAEFVATLSTGALTVDLTSLTGTNGGPVDGTGLRVQVLRVKNLGAADLTILTGASNGYGIGAGLVIPGGGHAQVFLNDGIHDIDSTHKTIDLAGTASQTSEWSVLMG